MPNYRKLVADLERMEDQPWWHRERWLLRWWDLTAPIARRYWLWRER